MACPKFHKSFQFLRDLVIFLLVAVLLFVPYILLSFYKTVLVYYAKLLFGIELLPFEGIRSGGYDLATIILDKSVVVSNVQPKPNTKVRCNIGVLIKYEGPPFSIDRFRREFYTKFIHDAIDGRSRKYLNLVVHYFSFGGHIFRKRVDSIDIKSHVYEVNLKERGQSLEEFCTQWLTEPYQPGKALWELVSINAGSAETCESYFALKIHHGLGDGVSIAHMLEVLVGQESLQPLPETTPFLRKVLYLIRTPSLFFTHVQDITEVTKQKVLRWGDPDDFSQHMVFGSLPLEQLKAARKRIGVRFIPILQALLGGAARRLHQERGLPIPENLVTASTLPWPKHPFQEKLCNWATMIVHRLPLSFSTSKDRLLAINKVFVAAVQDGVQHIVCPTGLHLVKLLPFLPWDKGDSGWDFVWSAMVLKGGYTLWGKKICNMFPLACLNARGIYLTAMSASHSDQLDFVMTGSGQIFSQQQLNNFKKYVYDELEEICGQEVLNGLSLPISLDLAGSAD